MTVVPLLRKVEPIGGSEAAAACGVDPHTSPTMLWLYKTGREPRPETEAMEWGNRLQEPIMDALRARHYDCEPWGLDPLVDPEAWWLIGHPDGTVVTEHGAGLLEVKTVNQWAKRGWDGPPIEYVAQCQTYMRLSGMPYALLAVLVGGQKLETHVIRHNEHAIGRILELTEEFYGYLVRDEPPPPDSSESARDAMAALFPESTAGRAIRLDKGARSALRELRARREQRDRVNEQIRGLENRLKLEMGDAEIALSPHDDEVIRWKSYERETVDLNALREAHPEIAAEFVKTTTTRRFQVL